MRSPTTLSTCLPQRGITAQSPTDRTVETSTPVFKQIPRNVGCPQLDGYERQTSTFSTSKIKLKEQKGKKKKNNNWIRIENQAVFITKKQRVLSVVYCTMFKYK